MIAGFYVEIVNAKRKTLTLYGPFRTGAAAGRARFFSYTEDVFESFSRDNAGMLFRHGHYTTGEIPALIADPESNGYRAIAVKPTEALKPNLRWAEYDGRTPGFSEKYFTDYYKAHFNKEPAL